MRFKLQAMEDINSGLGRAPQTYCAEFDAVVLPDVVQQIEQFLRGCGYYLYNLDYDITLPSS